MNSLLCTAFWGCGLEGLPGQAWQAHVTVHVSGCFASAAKQQGHGEGSACPQLNSDTLQGREAELGESTWNHLRC